MPDLYHFRDMRPSDIGFVKSSWILSFARSKYARGVGAVFGREHRPVVEYLLDTAEVTVACDVQNPDVILGWMCHHDDMVHYIVAKRTLHRAGLSKHLLADLLGDRVKRRCRYTHHLIELHDAGIEDILYTWVYDPYALARRSDSGEHETAAG